MLAAHRVIVPLAALLCAAAFPAHAAPRWETGVHFVYAEPRAEFAHVVDHAFGIQGHGVLYVDPIGIAGIRLDAGFLNYGNEKKVVPLSNTVQRVNVEVNTSNNIALIGIGPQLEVPVGPVRPYAYATISLGYFFTESSVKGNDSSNQPFASSTNFDDTTPGTSVGGGIRIPIVHPAAIDLGVEYRHHRQARYLAKGDIIEGPNGVELVVRDSDADLIMYRLGVTFTP